MTILSTAVTRTSEDWANRIQAKLQTSHDHHRQSVEGIIAAGLDLLQARTELKGHFQKMMKFELGWSQDKAEMLMAIAKNKVLTNPNMFGLLPKSWSTLFLMSKTEPKVLEAKLIDGTWNTETERKDVARLTDDKADAPIRLTPHDRFRHDQDKLVALYVKDAAKFKEFQDIVASITRQVRAVPPRDHIEQEEPLTETDDAEAMELFRSLADKDLSGDRPPPAPPPINDSGEPVPPPENAPSVVPDDDELSPELDRRPEWMKEREAGLSKWHRG